MRVFLAAALALLCSPSVAADMGNMEGMQGMEGMAMPATEATPEIAMTGALGSYSATREASGTS